jgi:HD-GYP domain-containing protein (c-di-GMP phosphodiesterase class II)
MKAMSKTETVEKKQKTVNNRRVKKTSSDSEALLAQIRRLTQIGTALSAEKNLDKLLEMIVDEARKFTHSNGGTLYITSDDETELQFAIVQNELLSIRMGGTGGKITWQPVKLKNPDGTPNHRHVSAYAALSREVVNIPDVYDAKGFNFEGTRQFDAETGYRSKSMLVVPMRNHENDIIGVLQLLDARDPTSGEVVTYSRESQEMTESLASQAAIALSSNRLIHDLEHLFDSFIRTIAAAIDEKSPYTGDHVRHVAELTMEVAEKINQVKDGPFAAVHFNIDQLNELRIAAWLHDVGKVTTPEYVIDKSTKLSTICDRIDLIKARFEVIRCENQLESIEKGVGKSKKKTVKNKDRKNYSRQLEDDLRFLYSANSGGEFMTDETVERIKDIAVQTWRVEGKRQPLLTEDELYNLSIRKGTLTDEERNIINNHTVVTYKMLSQLPFPKKMRDVPMHAAAHHEKLDGTGYPMGLIGDQISLQSRIIAMADIFEALTAKDRPYKKGHTLSEALKIMSFMVKDHHIDPDLYDLFMREKIYLKYAQQELAPSQLDQT